MNKETRTGGSVLRWILPSVLILIWLAAAGVGGPYFGKIDEVSSNDPTAYLPSTAEATQVQQQLTDFTGDEIIPAVLVLVSDTALTEAQLTELGALPEELVSLEGVASQPSPPIPSEDGRAVQLFVPVDASGDVGEIVATIRADLPSVLPDGVTAYLTGPAGLSGDLVQAFTGIDGILLLVALGAVLVILILVYRSPLLPILVLMTSMFALCTALLTVWWLAKAEVFPLSGQTQGILFILVIGAATDYSLLYVARFREALRAQPDRLTATKIAVRGTIEPVLASGGTVIAGLLMLLLSELASNRSLGPIAAIGIVFSMLAALTLLPALLLLTGRGAFWPVRVRVETDQNQDELPQRGIWARIPQIVSKHARLISISTIVLMLVASLGLTQLRADGVAASELVLGNPEAKTGQTLLGEHFPAGSGSPAQIIVAEDDLVSTAATVLSIPGVDGVTVTAADSPSGSATVTADGIQPLYPGAPAVNPTVVGGTVLLQATLTNAADSTEAIQSVQTIRDQLGDSALVGGVTATAMDSNAASIQDRNVIIPLILLVILVILVILLRSLLAPVILIGTVVLSYAATLGVSALVFNHIFQLPGADPAVPLFGFVFLVALGIDYNIFLMTRVREEALTFGARKGMQRGLAITGGVITSAGVVLAATFAALSVLPIMFLLQLAFIVAFGVLLDTLIIRTLLVPAIAEHLGKNLWWPAKRISD